MVSSAVEHCPHTAGVTGSNPVPPTIFPMKRDMVNRDMVNRDMVNRDMVNRDMVNRDMVNRDMMRRV